MKKYIFLVAAFFVAAFVVKAVSTDDEAEQSAEAPATEATTTPSASDDSESATESTASSTSTTNDSSIKYELPAPLTDRPEQIINHTGYTLSFNSEHNTPNWSAWELTSDELSGDVPRSTKFWADEQVKKRANRVDYYDYKDSGYDRGHMCPASDMKWNYNAMHDCFYMTNMCPQDRALNSGSWNSLENKCRSWARTEGSVYIVCGPVYDTGTHEQIGIDHAIDVPEGFFKAVLSLREGHEKAIAFYFNNTSDSQPYREAALSVDEIEELTGIDLFYQLDDKLEKKVESQCSIRDWR